MEEKKKISISEILSLLDKGYTRKEVQEHYGITIGECTKLFKHPKLTGKKPKSKVSFELVDDTEEVKEESYGFTLLNCDTTCDTTSRDSKFEESKEVFPLTTEIEEEIIKEPEELMKLKELVPEPENTEQFFSGYKYS
jgi:hypothetical protein